MTARVQTDTAAPQSAPARGRSVAFIAAALIAIGAALEVSHHGVRMGALLIVGAALGLTLYQSLFGFSSAWRAFVLRREGAGMRAQFLMLACASILFIPALASGHVFGAAVTGAVAPLSVSLLTGAFLFGIGMQLGGGCGSGTLFTAGGGNVRMMVTLAFFVLGSVLATAHVPWWFAQPGLGSASLLAHFDALPALIIQLMLLAGCIALTFALEPRRSHGTVPQTGPAGWKRALYGPWPLLAGAVILAGLNAVTLAVAGHPWGITYGFTLWGAELATVVGLDVSTWEFWHWSYHQRALANGVFANTTSVMNMGLLLGALLGAGLAGRFAPSLRIPLRSIVAAALGGLLMGYGARLAFGCNIGAFVGGVISTSAHGWVWFAVALAGTALGARLRPLFGLAA